MCKHQVFPRFIRDSGNPAHLSQQVLLQIVARQQHLPLVLPTLELVILPLSPQQACLLLRLQLLQTLLLVHQPLLFLPLWCRLVLVQFLRIKQAELLKVQRWYEIETCEGKERVYLGQDVDAEPL